MKKLAIALLSVVAPFMASASGQWTLQGNVYTVDTLYHAKVGPGTTQTSLKLSGPSALRVFYTTTDLTNPYVEMRATKASNKLAACATVTSQAKAYTKEGAQYFAGVNADFFGNQQPIGTTVVDGEIYYINNGGWTNWAIDANHTPYLGSMTLTGTVSANGTSHTLTSINNYRDENNLIIYTPRYGSNSGTNSYGAEVLLVPVSEGIAAGKNVTLKVSGAVSTAGSMAIPAGCYVLSGHGTGKTFVSSLTDGQEITVSTIVTANGQSIVPTQMLGGQPMILSGGEVLNTESALDHLVSLNPRTAIGHNATGDKLVMLVVDGRTNTSKGVVSKVLADMMRETGCTEAMNFDGGGSSALYIQAHGVVNSPSDGNERAVTNAVFAVANTPTDNNIAEIAFMDHVKELPKYGYYKPTIYGYNKYGVLISTNVEGVTLSCSNELGEVVEGGSTLFANGSGCHELTASYNGAKASLVVTIGTGTPKFRLDSVITDSYRDYAVEVTATVNGSELPLDNGALTWSSDDTSIATVDESGVIHGVKNGTTIIRGSVEDFAGELLVKVEIPETRYQAIDPGLDVNTWTLTKSNVKNQTITALGNDGLAIDFTISSARSPYVRIAKNIDMWSLPDSIMVEVNPGEVNISKMQIALVGTDGRSTFYEFSPTVKTNTVNRLMFGINEMVDATDMINYPVKFASLTFYVSGSTGVPYHIEMPSLCGVYTAVSESGGVDDIIADDNDGDLLLTPNPVVAGEVITINASEATTYTVYGINGVQITQGNGNTINTTGLNTGIYIVTANDNGNIRSARMIIK